MKEIIRESSGLEPILRSFVDASNTKYYKDALDLLFLNGSAFEAVENSGICSLVSLRGSEKNVDKSIDLIEGKSKTNLAKFLNEVFKAFLPGLIVAFRQTGISSNSGLGEKEIQTKMMTAFVTTMPELQKKMKELTGLFVNGAFLFSELVQVSIYKGFNEIRSSHLRTGINSDNYEKMIDQLTKLDVVEPKIRVSICPSCMNNELVISKYPSTNDICERCGNVWSSCILYLFDEQFGEIKSANNDLPLFISTYLKHQIDLNAFGEKVDIFPNAVLKVKEKEMEIDVYIPKYKIGIECKNYLTSSMPDTPTRIQSLAGQFRAQIMNYQLAGIEQIFIVANLPMKTFERVNQRLSEEFNDSNKSPRITIIQGNTNSLLEFLKSLSTHLIDSSTKELKAFFQEKLPDMPKKLTKNDEKL